MKMIRCFVLFGACILLLFGGCDCRGRRAAHFVADDVETDTSQQRKDDFERSIDLLNRLEESPCLPGTPGMERLIHTTDRLDKWIAGRAVDETWKADETFLAMGAAAQKTTETAREVIRILHRLQGVGETDEQGNPLPPPASLEEERQKISRQLQQLVSDIQEMMQLCGISSSEGLTREISEIKSSFDRLSQVKNIDTAGIRAYAKSLETQTVRIGVIADRIEKFAGEMQTQGLFLHTSDVEYLKQCVWLRNVSQWACGDKQVLLDRAWHLFDWTVCNIDARANVMQQGNQSMPLPAQYPWQTMLLGYGTTWDRALVFIELLRQQRIDTCLISTPMPDQSGSLSWAVGVLLDGEIYLFLPSMGLALPGPGGPAFSEDGSLGFPEIATLSQVFEDDNLLRQLDFTEESRFPITSEFLSKSTFYIVASPETTSLRMKTLEADLSGEQNMVLYTDLAEQRKRLEAHPKVTNVEIWNYPCRMKFEQIFMGENTNSLLQLLYLNPNPKRSDFPIWTGRILYFKGRIGGQESAMTNLQQARISDRDIMEYRNNPAFRNDPTLERLFRWGNLNSTYWLGLASFENDSITAAFDFFREALKLGNDFYSTPGAVISQAEWSDTCEYMMGRTSEIEKKYDEAAAHFRQATRNPESSGNLLRAKWLAKLISKETAPGSEKLSEATNPQP